jgi:ssDNA-binding Zn-finger/Zn-ribbon topoisomerase 1
MANQRKIRCDCGGFLQEEKTRFGDIQTAAMVCPHCAFTTLTKKQAEEYVKLKQFHHIMDAERKVIKIGNSMGITLPEDLGEFGVKIGKKIRTEALSANSFKVEFSA